MVTEELTREERMTLGEWHRRHGARVRRATAMALLEIHDPKVFAKVVDANPGLVHRLPGECQAKYVTAVLLRLMRAGTARPVCDPRGGQAEAP